MELTLEDLRNTNLSRAMVWHPDGIEEWSVNDWAVALGGEAGECLNKCKKLKRIDSNIRQANGMDREQMVQAIGEEIADVVLYADLLASRLGFRLEDLLVSKFNDTSIREGFSHRL